MNEEENLRQPDRSFYDTLYAPAPSLSRNPTTYRRSSHHPSPNARRRGHRVPVSSMAHVIDISHSDGEEEQEDNYFNPQQQQQQTNQNQHENEDEATFQSIMELSRREYEEITLQRDMERAIQLERQGAFVQTKLILQRMQKWGSSDDTACCVWLLNQIKSYEDMCIHVFGMARGNELDMIRDFLPKIRIPDNERSLLEHLIVEIDEEECV